MKQITNDPGKAGQLADAKHVFGPRNRYAIAPVHSRFDSVGWFVWDAETIDANDEHDPIMGYPPAVIRVCTTREEALLGLK